MKSALWIALVLASPVLERSAFALPTMIRLGYTNCASCHIAPQGGGLLNNYGKGIDQAQSLQGGEYVPSDNSVAKALRFGGRMSQDLRVVGQETLSTTTGGPLLGVLRSRFMYRNATELGGGWRVSAVVVGENVAAPRPGVAYDPPVKPTTVYVTQALISYRPTKTLEFSVGKDQLPTGLNLPDLGTYMRARDQYGYYDAPTQVKAFIWGKRYHISPYLFGPGGNERTGFHETGGGGLAEVDVLGHGRTVVGVNALHGTSTRMDRTMVGPYARLGFGRWGIFAEHDITDRNFNQVATGSKWVSFRQQASYAQFFFAVREWLVPSLGFERLTVQAPYAESLIGPRIELAARLSSNFTLGFTSRIQRNEINGKMAPSVALSLAMKTVN
jgi:hypothetical protein